MVKEKTRGEDEKRSFTDYETPEELVRCHPFYKIVTKTEFDEFMSNDFERMTKGHQFLRELFPEKLQGRVFAFYLEYIGKGTVYFLIEYGRWLLEILTKREDALVFTFSLDSAVRISKELNRPSFDDDSEVVRFLSVLKEEIQKRSPERRKTTFWCDACHGLRKHEISEDHPRCLICTNCGLVTGKASKKAIKTFEKKYGKIDECNDCGQPRITNEFGYCPACDFNLRQDAELSYPSQ